MKFSKENLVPFAGILSIAGFMLFSSLIANNFDIDAIRPDINKDQGLIVTPDVVDNEELNDTLSVDVAISNGDVIMEGEADEEMDGSDITTSKFAENKYTRVSHKDYTAYLETTAVKVMNDVYNKLSSENKNKVYFCIFYRGHNVNENNSATVIEYADPYSRAVGSASNLGGMAISSFALRYTYDLSIDNKNAVTQGLNNLKATMKKMEQDYTFLEATSEYTSAEQKQYLKMWGLYVDDYKKVSNYLSKAVSATTALTASEYLPNIKQSLIRGTETQSITINNTTSSTQSGNTYIPMMSIDDVKILLTPYNQYANKDGDKRTIRTVDDTLLARCVDDGYSKLMVIFGSESGTNLRDIIGEENHSFLHNIILNLLNDTDVTNSTFKDANLILKGEKALS